MSGRLLIIVAPSGGGKTSVINHLMDRHPGIIHSISYTTRPARPEGVDEGYYQIVDKASFREGIDDDAFVEWAEVHGHLYGTPRAPLEGWLGEGRDVVLDLDVVGALNLKRSYGDRAVTLFLVPPSMDELRQRLALRGADSAEVQSERLRNAEREMEYRDQFDYQVINDDLLRACREVESILYNEDT